MQRTLLGQDLLPTQVGALDISNARFRRDPPRRCEPRAWSSGRRLRATEAVLFDACFEESEMSWGMVRAGVAAGVREEPIVDARAEGSEHKELADIPTASGASVGMRPAVRRSWAKSLTFSLGGSARNSAS